MYLGSLCKLLGLGVVVDQELFIEGIESDSRNVKIGFIFCAIDGKKHNGNDFIDDAISNGASVIVTSDKNIRKSGAFFIVYDNVRLLYSLMVSVLFSQKPNNIVAVTGTNGKTSIISILNKLIYAMKRDVVSVGTLGVTHNGEILRSNRHFMTTPDSKELNMILCDAKKKGVNYAFLEASSHGLSQYRLSGLNVKVAVFTNLSHDHLDYHNEKENYFAMKKRLFTEVLSINGMTVLNKDIKEFNELFLLSCSKNVITYGFDNDADVCILDNKLEKNGQIIKLLIDNIKYELQVKLYGGFQSYNIACVVSIMIALGFNVSGVIEYLNNLKLQVKGRMEVIFKDKSVIIVDYAHTPDALLKSLCDIKAHFINHKRVIIVFGCGGDRDKEKRKLMGKIAEKYANLVIVTNDSPRFEDPTLIRSMIIAGCPNAIAIPDREKAIRYAISILNDNTILLISGKGHEAYTEINGKLFAHNDMDVLLSLL